MDVRGTIEARYGLPVVMNNDLTAHALGEYFFGCGSGIERFMCMAVGTGLGAALIVEGKPLIIDGGNSGNTGLIILDPTAPRDNNGIRGSAEGLCGVAGIERLARERYGRFVPGARGDRGGASAERPGCVGGHGANRDAGSGKRLPA